jgi:hypothetical protein
MLRGNQHKAGKMVTGRKVARIAAALVGHKVVIAGPIDLAVAMVVRRAVE